MTGAKKRFAAAAALSMLLMMSGGCSSHKEERGEREERGRATQNEVSDFTKEAEAHVDSVLAGMTLEEKVGQLLMPAMYSRYEVRTMVLLREYVDSLHVGGVVLLKGTVEESAQLSDSLRRMSSVEPFVAIDAEWGLAMRMKGMPEFPRFAELGKGDVDDVLMYDYGEEMGRELCLAGFNMLLGPVADVSAGRKGAIGKRSLGAEPQRVAELALAYMIGVESRGVLAVVKHFPGHGDAADSHRQLPLIRKSRAELDSVDLVPFRMMISNGASAIMVGHLMVPALGDSLPAAVSPNIITGLLRNEMGFRGLVLTDALNMEGARGFGASDAIAAGADIVLAPADTYAARREIIEALRSGKLTEDIIDDRCRRILFYKYALSMGEGSGQGVSPSQLINGEESSELMRRLRKAVKERRHHEKEGKGSQGRG